MKRTGKTESKRGQVMLEYVVALGVFVAMLGLCALLIYSFKSFGGRIISIMAIA